MIRVLLVDDHAIVRQGLERLFSTADDIEVVGSAGDGARAVELVRQLQPDVVLMDLSMPVLDGVRATSQITTESPTTVVVVLTSYGEESRILEALNAGARGYLLKHTDPEGLLEAVRSAAARLMRRWTREPVGCCSSNGVVRRGPRELTPREVEVLLLVGDGLANKQIGRRLGISERTVKAHLTSVFARIGVTDRVQAALWARDNLPR